MFCAEEDDELLNDNDLDDVILNYSMGSRVNRCYIINCRLHIKKMYENY